MNIIRYALSASERRHDEYLVLHAQGLIAADMIGVVVDCASFVVDAMFVDVFPACGLGVSVATAGRYINPRLTQPRTRPPRWLLCSISTPLLKRTDHQHTDIARPRPRPHMEMVPRHHTRTIPAVRSVRESMSPEYGYACAGSMSPDFAHGHGHRR
ncbi:hypothetical protein B0H17DRAFT_1205717 [Mycena rosella]|uniref:Uncharacterized protein n=1 Tax=Mycena rosella TaxID=1033263 RepID=A0AAD7D6J9_MYCRO|nr:hypothetical protein B0H17DRAFT_1205717 [Mycena rosella]